VPPNPGYALAVGCRICVRLLGDKLCLKIAYRFDDHNLRADLQAPRPVGLSQSLISPFFGLSRLPKADAFASPVILNEVNPGGFERPAEGCFICEGNRDFPVSNLGSTDCCDADS
jgi:hypothetical protein